MTSTVRIPGLTIRQIKVGRDSQFEEFCMQVVGPAVSRQRTLTPQ